MTVWIDRRPASVRPLVRSPGLTPTPEHLLGCVEGADDPACILDHALDEEVHAGALAAEAPEVGEQADDAPLLRVRAHERVEHADLAGGAVVDRRTVEDRKHRVGP